MNFKNLKFCDISMIKLSVFFAALFLVSVWSGFANWVVSVHWVIFLVLALLLAVKPMIVVFKK